MSWKVEWWKSGIVYLIPFGHKSYKMWAFANLMNCSTFPLFNLSTKIKRYTKERKIKNDNRS